MGMRARRISMFWVKLTAFLCLLLMCNAAGALLNGGVDTSKSSDALKHLPRNSVDVLWVGSSHIYDSIIPQKLYDEYGIASAMLSMQNLTLQQMYWGLKEVLLSQSPDVVVIDMYTAAVPYTYNAEFNRRFKKSFHTVFDENQMKRIAPLLQNTSISSQSSQMARWLPVGSVYKPFAMLAARKQYGTPFEEVLTITKLHERYSELSQKNFLTMRAQSDSILDFGTEYHANIMNPDSVKQMDYTLEHALGEADYHFWQFTEEQLAEVELLPTIRQDIERMIQLAREHDIKLVFCVVPYVINAAENVIFQQIASIAQDEDVAFVGADAIQIEDDQLFNMGHLNVYGALRYTAFWGEELTRRFDLPDRRQSTDRRYAAWREHQGRYLTQIAVRREYDTMSEYLEMLASLDDDFIILLGFQGPVYERFTEDDYWLLVEELGIPEEILAQWYDTEEGTLNVLVHNKRVLASNYKMSGRGYFAATCSATR